MEVLCPAQTAQQKKTDPGNRRSQDRIPCVPAPVALAIMPDGPASDASLTNPRSVRVRHEAQAMPSGRQQRGVVSDRHPAASGSGFEGDRAIGGGPRVVPTLIPCDVRVTPAMIRSWEVREPDVFRKGPGIDAWTPQPTPVAIVGLPRSGSTLVEQILARIPAGVTTRVTIDETLG